MPTYALSDKFTDDQRKSYCYEMSPEDAIEIAMHLLEHFPAVLDDAITYTARPYRVQQMRATKEKTS